MTNYSALVKSALHYNSVRLQLLFFIKLAKDITRSNSYALSLPISAPIVITLSICAFYVPYSHVTMSVKVFA